MVSWKQVHLIKQECSEGLQPMEDLCGTKDNPRGTVACEGLVVGQENSKKEGTTERKCCALIMASLKG